MSRGWKMIAPTASPPPPRVHLSKMLRNTRRKTRSNERPALLRLGDAHDGPSHGGDEACLPFMWPQRFGQTWSSSNIPATRPAIDAGGAAISLRSPPVFQSFHETCSSFIDALAIVLFAPGGFFLAADGRFFSPSWSFCARSGISTGSAPA